MRFNTIFPNLVLAYFCGPPCMVTISTIPMENT